MEKNYQGNYYADFSELNGKTIIAIENLSNGSETVVFKCSDETEYQMHYYQDCCANCSVEDVVGDVEDLIGSPILLAEEVSSSTPDVNLIEVRKAKYEKEKAEFRPSYEGDEFYFYGPSPKTDWMDESETWTFYKLATIKGSVTIRWYGSSNGYYSETATFERTK